MSICAKTISPSVAAVDDLLQHPHRLVVAHVLVDREDLAGSLRPRRAASIASSSDSASGFCARIALMCGCFSAWRISAGCWSGGKARSTISTSGSSISCFRRVVDRRDAPALGDLRGVGLGARGDRHDREAGLLVGGEMALGHDHAGADAADLVLARADLHVRLELPWTAIVILPFPGARGSAAARGEIVHPRPARRTAPRAPRAYVGLAAQQRAQPRLAGVERHHRVAAERLDLEDASPGGRLGRRATVDA